MDTSISIWDHLPNLKYQKIDFFLMTSTCIICYFASNHSSIFAQPVNARVFLRNLPNQNLYPLSTYVIQCKFPQCEYAMDQVFSSFFSSNVTKNAKKTSTHSTTWVVVTTGRPGSLWVVTLQSEPVVGELICLLPTRCDADSSTLLLINSGQL
jgi:hypothetical protein